MKIAIKGHVSRGKEVIQILESLGGKNKYGFNGTDFKTHYFITEKNIIDRAYCANFTTPYKFYILEEFEKEFPFKIGDIIILKGVNKPYEIIALEWYMNKLCYKLDNGLHFSPSALITCGEMKKERNITLTLDKAKEWYNKGGELKEVALQAYSEEELTKIELPKTWEEFCKKYPVKIGEACINDDSEIDILLGSEPRDRTYYKNICPSKKSAEAHLAMIQLEQLRDCWRNGWKPDWLDGNEAKYAVKCWRDTITIERTYVTCEFLSFKTYEVACEFQQNFKDLIKKAGDLI